MEYKKHVLENLTSEELSEIAEYEHPFSDENAENIKSRFKAGIGINNTEREAKPVMKKKTRFKKAYIAVIAAAFAVFLLGFTNADRIQEAYYNYFGGGAEISSRAAEIGVSSTDQGIQMDVISAINDGSHTYLVISMKDLTGDRVSEDMRVEDLWSLEGGQGLGGGNISLMSYDPGTKTAILVASAIGGRAGKDAIFTLPAFVSDRTDFDVMDNTVDLAALASLSTDAFERYDTSRGYAGGYGPEFEADGKDLKDIPQALKRDAMNVQIPGYDKGYISNIAYKDGLLHIQLNPENGSMNDAHFVSLINNSTGEEIQTYYSINYGVYAYNEKVKVENDYLEFVFKIDEATLNDFSLRVEGWSFTNIFNGNLQVGFKVPEQIDVISVPADIRVSGASGECLISSIEISPLSITLSAAEGRANLEDFDLRLVYKDGTKVAFGGGLSERMNNDGAETLRYNGFISNFEDLAAIEVNGQTVNLL